MRKIYSKFKIGYSLCALLMLYSTSAASNGIVATIKPLHSLICAIACDTTPVHLLLGDHQSPHHAQLRPSQFRLLQHADVVFYIDPTFEMGFGLDNLPKTIKKIAVLPNAVLIKLPVRTGKHWQSAHHHRSDKQRMPNSHSEGEHDEHDGHDDHDGHGDHDGHDEHDDHGKHGKHHEHEAAADRTSTRNIDPHIWLDPDNALGIAQFIFEQLSDIYPENKASYRKNLRKTKNKLAQLDADLTAQLAGLQARPFVVLHDGYQYFEQAYHLHNIGALSLSHQVSHRQLRRVRARLRQTHARCIFHEPQSSNRLIDVVAEGLHTDTGVLDAIGIGLQPGENLYFELMQNLGDNFNGCLR